ncbi:SH3 domain-containing protein [Erythrobacter sp. THAF29]|uniref:SH3 domain-containing protein n=1 Tax=Erythrobacter sp. THAF29 TaxID=2587851 RepID=UPI001267C0A5|nr:SH3 domain-containing protein [Erythrobacter sp. THAF29]QFT78005.1 Bacterial SH3 domain protein [Erythrobacter sp. THAF29]
MTAFRLFAVLALTVFLGLVIATDGASAQDRETPYWASLRYDEVRMRVGPSQEYPIEWVYKRKGLPVKVVRVRESWRFVEDPEGDRGWIARSQLVPDRGALVVGEGLVDMRAAANPASALRWRAEPGVVGKLLRCEANWCEIDVAGRIGWAPQERLWGAGEP